MFNFAGSHPWFQSTIREVKKAAADMHGILGAGGGHVSFLIPPEARESLRVPGDQDVIEVEFEKFPELRHFRKDAADYCAEPADMKLLRNVGIDNLVGSAVFCSAA